MAALRVRAIDPADRDWVNRAVADFNGSSRAVSRGRLHDVARLPGFIAEQDGERVGVITMSIEGGECEIVTLNSLVEGAGIGSALIEAVRQEAMVAGCRRLWLITTNDNTPALRFYQRQGFRLAALRPGAVDAARRTLKPEIPLTGVDGIPIRDEIELELLP